MVFALGPPWDIELEVQDEARDDDAPHLSRAVSRSSMTNDELLRRAIELLPASQRDVRCDVFAWSALRREVQRWDDWFWEEIRYSTDEYFAQLLHLLSGGMPAREPRRMPSKKKIADHHGMPVDECWRCCVATEHLERAHIVDRMGWESGAGLDDAQNLALLCHGCHKLMPIVRPEDWRLGLDYVFGHDLSRLLLARDLSWLLLARLPFVVGHGRSHKI